MAGGPPRMGHRPLPRSSPCEGRGGTSVGHSAEADAYPGAVSLSPTSRARIEKRLSQVGRRLSALRTDLAVAEQAVVQVDGEADDARLRALVSETPLAEREHHEIRRQADVQRRNRDELLDEIAKLEQRQDELLDQYTAS